MIKEPTVIDCAAEKDWEILVNQQSKRFLGAIARFEDCAIRLLSEGVSPIVIKLAFFYQWTRLISWSQNVDNRIEDDWLKKSEDIMLPVIKLLRKIMMSLSSNDINKGEGPLAVNLQNKLKSFDPRIEEGVSKKSIDEQFFVANQALFTAVEATIKTKLSMQTLSSICLFYWFRCYSAVTDIAPEDARKVEQHWGRVMDAVSDLVKTKIS